MAAEQIADVIHDSHHNYCDVHAIIGEVFDRRSHLLAQFGRRAIKLIEDDNMRAISRVADVSINTVTKLLVDAGLACARFRDETVRGVKARRIQCDEIWSFCYSKAKNVKTAKAAPVGAGDVWTWTALDSDSKLIVSYLIGGRDGEYAIAFMDDLRGRLANRVQLTTDGHRAYLNAVDEAFGIDVDYAQLVKLYGEAPETRSGIVTLIDKAAGEPKKRGSYRPRISN